jgi:hypothetical protein
MANLTEQQFDRICAKLDRMRASLHLQDGKWLFYVDLKDSKKVASKFHDYMTTWIKEQDCDLEEFMRAWAQNPEDRWKD